MAGWIDNSADYWFQVSGFGCQGTEVLNPRVKLQIVEGMWNGFNF